MVGVKEWADKQNRQWYRKIVELVCYVNQSWYLGQVCYAMASTGMTNEVELIW